jgi:hypothetical protein
VSVSYALMCHPARQRFVGPLAEAIGGDVSVIWDKHQDRLETGQRALLAYDEAATHHCVVQDDGIVSPDFRAAIDRLVDLVPDNPISLYTGRTRPKGQDVQQAVRRARRRRLSWVVLDELYWGVGTVIPTALIAEMVEFHRLVNARIENWDAKMSFFFAQRGIRIFYTQPSLVDHRDASENPSLIPGRWASGRVAHWFIGDYSPLKIDWETKALHMDRTGSAVIVNRERLVSEGAGR